MEKLTFEIQRDYQIDTSKNKPLNNEKLDEYKNEVIKELAPYIRKINNCNGCVLITVKQDGASFTHRLKNVPDPLFGQILDELHCK